jgi:hypothetical protein
VGRRLNASSGWGARLEGWRLRLARSRTAPEIGLIVVLVAAFALNLWARHGDYFFYDEYGIVIHFYSLSDLLHPSNGHPLVMWLSLYYLMRDVFGLGSALPYELVGIAAGLFAAGLLFVEVRRRAGAWAGLVAAILLLFIASGIDILFWSFELAFAGSVSAGIGAVMALDRDDRRGDVVALVLLVVAVFFLLVGLPFVAAAATAVLIAEDGRSWGGKLRRLALVVGPVLVLFVIWYLAYGHLSPSRITSDNVLAAPGFVLGGLGSTLAFLVGAGISPRTAAASEWAIPLLAAGLALAAWRWFRGPAVSRRIWIWAVALLALWVLTAVGNPLDGVPDTGRYLWPSAALIILIAAELVRGLRLGWPAVGLALLLVVCSVLGSRGAFDEARFKLNPEATNLRANLGALEIARDTVDPKLQLIEEVVGSPFEGEVDAGSYFKSADLYGTPAYSPERILALPEIQRANVDRVLRAALPVTLIPEAAKPAARSSCVELQAGSELTARRSLWVQGGVGGAALGLRRFGDEFASVGEVGSGQSALVSIPRDRSSVPWRLQVTSGDAEVCQT